MACDCEVRALGLSDIRLESAVNAAIAEVRRIEARYSRYRGDSIVSQINNAAGMAAVELDAEAVSLLDFAQQLYVQSEGRFDITSGVLRRAWNFRGNQLPHPADIAKLLTQIGWDAVDWPAQASGRQLRLPRVGMEIDFGGFGKEYAADRAAAVLVQQGVRGGYVNLGGDIRVIGPDAQGQAWRFGIQHPRQGDAVISVIELAAGALATSGDYERFIEVDGQRYCHLLDARSGWPVQGWQSISVVSPLCVAAGALSTIAMLSGSQAQDVLDAQSAQWLGVNREGALIRSGL